MTRVNGPASPGAPSPSATSTGPSTRSTLSAREVELRSGSAEKSAREKEREARKGKETKEPQRGRTLSNAIGDFRSALAGKFRRDGGNDRTDGAGGAGNGPRDGVAKRHVLSKRGSNTNPGVSLLGTNITTTITGASLWPSTGSTGSTSWADQEGTC